MGAWILAGACGAPQGVVPVIQGTFWPIANNPDLGALQGAQQQTVDLGVWRAADGSVQLWSCIRGTNVGGQGRLFYHWQAHSFTDTSWTPLGIAMEADPQDGETLGGLQAPFVISANGTFHMYYGDWTAICEQTSTDGKTFTRRLDATGQCKLFEEGDDAANTRDPMVLFDDGKYLVYYSASVGGSDADYVRTSTDLVTWSASTKVAAGGQAGSGFFSAECPFVVKEPSTGMYFLFRTQAYGQNAQTSVYRSPDPMSFGVDDDRYFVGTLPVAAPELVHDGSDWFIVTPNATLDGYQAARLGWTTGDHIP
ncbi:MAG TPA: hypothetical protein VLM85_28385 [Polyangiaceae bacterium]|nr:hypothetical protein [Polyangiaceae bacterium]